MKKWLLPTLILLLALCIPALAESSDWSFNEEYYVLNGYAGSGGAVVVPGQIGEGTVDVIGENAIKSDSITALTLPETLLEMRNGAVSWCNALTEVTLPESLIVIGDQNFWNCGALASVTIPAGVRYIGEYSFYFSAALKEITFEGVCPVIGTSAFSSIAEGAVAYVPDDQMEAYKAAFEAAGSEVTVQASGKNAAVIDNDGFADDLFEIDPDGTITAYFGYATYLRIPETVGGIPVKAIGDSVFRADYYLAVLELPEGLESIGVSAFEGCETLQYVAFPSTLVTIADRAFANGYSGKTLELSGVQTIGANAFESARINTAVTLPEGLVSIGDNAFSGCISIPEFYLPSTLESVGSGAFSKNWALTYIYFDGETLPQLGDNAFAECSVLADIDLNEHCTKQQMLDLQAVVDAQGLTCRVWRMQNTQVQYVESNAATYENGLLTSYAGSLTAIRPHDSFDGIKTTGIADGALKDNQTVEYFAVCYNDLFTTIGASAFEGSSLKHVDLFDSVTTIGARAFANCVQLEELTIPESVTEIGEGAFEGLTSLRKVTILCDASLIPEGSFANCTALTEAVIQQGAVPANLFAGSALTTLSLGENVTGIGANAFADTAISAVEHVNQFNAMTTIGARAFANCAQLEELTIPESVMEIGEGAFEGLTSLRKVTILCDASLIPEGSFANCTALTEAVIQQGAVPANLFAGSALTTLSLGENVTGIGANAFADTAISAVEHVNQFNAMTTIGARAFANCAQLEELTIPESVMEIGEGAFEGLTSLRKVTILCDASLIPEGSFANCTALTEAVIQQGAVPANLFAGSALTTLSLGENVTGIGAKAFADTALSAVNLSNITEIGEGAFANTALTAVILKADVNVASNAFAGTAAEIRVSAFATDEQLTALNVKLATPWYNPLVREGEESSFVKMPFEATSAECFDFDPETGLISAYTGKEVDVVVPREIGGVTVVGFSNYNVFGSCRDYTNTDIDTNQTEWVHLRTLVLPETIQSLPDELLSYMQQLETFICYAPLESTGRQLFMMCKSLDTVIFVNGVRMIDNYAFDNAGSLTNLYFGAHVDRIGESVFNFAGISSFVADATEISYGAFSSCENLTSLHFTSKVSSFAQNCVVNCPNLSEVCFDGCDFSSSEMGLLFHVAEQLTVRVPEGMDDDFMNHAQNCVSWSQYESEITIVTDACNHKLPEKPDVTALVPDLPVAMN